MADKPGLVKRFRYWLYRRDNDVPSREEMRELLNDVAQRYNLLSRMYSTVVRYTVYGLELNVIAAEQGMTRERVRQILWKAWRESSPLHKPPRKDSHVDSDV